MAEVVKANPRGRRPVFPWELWFSKLREDSTNVIVCKRGTDFKTPLEVFRNQVLNAAKSRDIVVTTKVDVVAGTVSIQRAHEDGLK